jgi:uncharacterized membrane protein YraQ (UPF0718 family)
MTDILSREFIYLWFYFSVLFEQIAPYWAVGILLGSVISVFGKEKIHNIFDSIHTKKWGIWGILPASLLGIASPLCMYGSIPIAASFSQKGTRDDWLAAFMMSSILLNPQLIAYSAALGPTALLIRIVSSIICGVTAGVLVHAFYREKPFFRFSAFQEPENRDTHPNILVRLLANIGRNIRATAPYFLVGLLLAVLFQRYVPVRAFGSLFGKERGFGVLLAVTMGVPLYVCGGGTIPLLVEWLKSGMSMGAAAAFMITGPATKITNLGALKTILGMRHFLLYLLYVILFSLVTGLLINIFYY